MKKLKRIFASLLAVAMLGSMVPVSALAEGEQPAPAASASESAPAPTETPAPAASASESAPAPTETPAPAPAPTEQPAPAPSATPEPQPAAQAPAPATEETAVFAAAPLTVSSTKGDVRLTKRWNDNAAKTGRPAADSLPLQVYYALQKDGKTYVWNAAANAMQAVTGTDTGFLPFSEAAKATDPILAALYPAAQVPALPAPNTTTSTTEWTYTFQNEAQLPTAVTVNGTQYTAVYGLKETGTVAGYVFVPAQTNPNDGTAAVLANTLSETFSATLQWLDDANAYDTRPENFAAELTGHLTLYRYVAGNPGAAAAVADADGKTVLQASNTSAAKWTVTAGDLPVYDPDGNPYVYYVDETPNIAGANAFAAKNSGAGQANAGDTYTFLYDNAGTDYATDTAHLYNNGTVSNTLTNTVGYTAKKVWDDAENPAGRPACTLYLYRVAATKILTDGTIVYNPQDGSPVSGFDSKPVPTKDGGSPIPVGQSTDIPFADADALPKYDADGNLYVYFAVERGLTGDYRQEITPAGGKTYQAQDEKGNALTGSYVLNGDTLTNRLQKDADLTATKTYRANAMQSLDPDTTTATFKLQSSTDGGTTWTDVKDQSNAVTIMLGGEDSTGTFRPENTKVSGTIAQTMPQYDPTGKKLAYRWREIGMTVNGASAAPAAADGFTDGQLVTVDAKGAAKDYVAPGVGDSYTTAKFKVQYNDDGSVTNILEGNTQLKLTKVWNGNGTIPDSVTLTLYQNGALYKVNGSSTVTLTKDQNWTALLTGLPRYDAQGNEYTYTVAETGAQAVGWQFGGITYTKTVETETATGDRVTQTAATVANVINPGTALTFDVDKSWLDDNDLLSRKEVTVGLYQKQADGSWKQLQTATLNEGNLWNPRFTVSLPEGSTPLTVDDFAVMELTVGGVPVQNPDVGKAKANEDTIHADNAGYFADTTTAATKDLAAGTVGVLADGATRTDALNNQYYVYVGRLTTGDDKTHAAYTVYNQRFGVVNLTLTKTWMASGATPKADFAVYQDGKAKPVETFSLGDNGTQNTDSVTISAITTDPANKNQKSQTVTVSGLPKYDAAGKQLSYTVKENAIGNVTVQDGTAVVNGDTYMSTVSYKGVTYAGDDKHRTGDLYTWAGANVRQETYALTVNKVWQDDGNANKIARPDVRFTVYRTTAGALIDAKLLTTNETELTAQTTAAVARLEGMTGAEVQTLKAAEGVSTVSVDNLWNTQHNQWYWSCDLGSVPRYDANGYPYIYFLLETVSGNAANYKTLYFNGTAVPSGNTEASTEAVFAHSCVDSGVTAGTAGTKNDYGNVLVVADGIASGTAKYDPARYSRTTVNYRQKALTLQGKKLWHFPAGITLSNAQLPSVTVHAYRSTAEQTKPTYDSLKAAVAAATVAEVNSKTLNPSGNGDFSYLFTQDAAGQALQYYDNYGRSYFYYVAEEPVKGYPTLTSIANSFTITNTYTPTPPWVKISLTKTWATDAAHSGKIPTATAVFTLYAICQNQDSGAGTDISGTQVTVATGTLTATAAGSQTLVFGGGNETYAKVAYTAPFAQSALPYYGPNGKPYRYFIKETTVPNGYTAAYASANADASKVTVGVYDAAAQTYTAAAEAVTDTYTGDTTTYTATKTWAGDSRPWVSADYRPASVIFTLHRNFQNKTADTGFTGPAQTVSSANSWKATFAGLDKYAPDGTAYIYYVTESVADADQTKSASYQQGADANSTAAAASTTGSIANTLDTTVVQAKKVWSLMLNGTGSPVAATEAQLKTLFDLGALPQSITFTVQHKISGNWADVSDDAGTGKLKYTYRLNTWENVQTLLNASANGTLKWSNLPKYEVGYNAKSADAASHLVAYRVTETVAFKEGELYTVKVGDDGSTAGTLPYGSWTGTAAKDAQGVFNFTNTLPVREASIEKVWQDGSNQDGLRPASLTFTLTRDGGNKADVVLAMDAAHQVGGVPNKYTTGIFYVPLYQNNSTTAYSAYAAAEPTAITGYTVDANPVKAHTATDPLKDVTSEATNYNDFTFTNAQTPLTYALTAQKSWSGESSWSTMTRPATVYLQLQYKLETEADYRPADAACGLAKTDTAIHPAQGATWKTAPWTVYQNLVNGSGVTGKHPIQYRVAEMTKAADGIYTPLQNNSAFGYTLSGGTLAANSTEMTLTNTLKTTTVKLQKLWRTSDGTTLTNAQLTALYGTGALPKKLRFTLYYKTPAMAAAEVMPSAGKKVFDVNDAALLGAGGATGWSGLPAYMVDQPVTYTVTEEISFDGTTYLAASPSNITPEYSTLSSDTGADQNVTTTLKIVNKIELGSLTATKVWQDESNRDGQRPASVTLQLVRDGANYGSPVAVNAPWTATWADLPVYQSGSATAKSVYTVVETKVGDTNLSAQSAYTAAYSGGVSLDGTSALTVTNTYTAQKFTVTANKQFADTQNGIDWSGQTRPASVYLTLQYKTAAGAWQKVASGTDYTAGNAVLTASAVTQNVTVDASPTKNAASWSGLRAYYLANGVRTKIIYRVVETNANGTIAAANGYTQTLDTTGFTYDAATGAADKTYRTTIGNTLDTASLTVNKTWNDTGYASLRPSAVVFQVQYRHGASAWADLLQNGQPRTITLQPLDKTADAQWTATLTGLPKADKNGDPYAYRVLEVSAVYNGTTLQASGGAWDADNELHWTGSLVGYTADVVTTANKGGGWTAAAANTLLRGAIQATKTWQDGSDRDGKRPASVTVTLYRDPAKTATAADIEKTGTQVGSKTLTAANNWTAAWADLPLYRADGSLSSYRMVETAVDGYATVYGGNAVDAGKTLTANSTVATAITNTYSPKKFAVSASKVWADDNDQYRLRPGNVTLALTAQVTDANGKAHGLTVVKGSLPAAQTDTGTVVYTESEISQTVSAANWWQAAWSGLPTRVRYNGQSLAVQYNIAETGAGTSYTATAAQNITSAGEDKTITVTNTLAGKAALTVQKSWDAAAASANALPDSVAVQLQYRAKNTAAAWSNVQENGTAALTAANSWFASFANLRDDYEYRAVETGMTYTVDGKQKTVAAAALQEAGAGQSGTVGSYVYASATTYTTATKTYATTLTNTLPQTSLTVTKTWQDDADRDGLQGPVTLVLYRDGVQTADTITLDGTADKAETAPWTAAWSRLPIYRNGSATELSVYTVQETQINGVAVANTAYAVTTVYDGNAKAAGSTLPQAGSTAAVAVTNTHTPDTFTVEAAKAWVDDGNSNLIRPQSVSFTLQYRDPAVADAAAADAWKPVPAKGSAAVTPGVTPTLAEGQQNPQTVSGPAFSAKAVWTVPRNANAGTGSAALLYRVVEAPTASYTASYAPQTVQSAAAGTTVGLTVTNTLAETSLQVTKAWLGDGDDAFATRPDSITVKLQRSTDGKTWADAPTPAPLTLQKSQNWAAATFAHLPVYADDANTAAYRYRAVETQLTYGSGLLAKKVAVQYPAGEGDPGTAGVYGVAAASAALPATDGSPAAYATVLTNTLAVTALRVDKIWAADAGDFYGTRPAYSLTVQLQRRLKVQNTGLLGRLFNLLGGSAADGWADVTRDGKPLTGTLVYDAAAKTWQTAVLENLPAANAEGALYEYRAVEVTAVPGYTSATANDADGHTAITNTLQTVGVQVNKQWRDAANRYATRLDSLTLTLLNQNGALAVQPVFTRTSAEGDQWVCQAAGLPKYLPGTDTPAVYTVRETAPAGYAVDHAEAAVQNGAVSFVNTLEVVSLGGTKTWQDYANRYGSRPEAVVLTVTSQNGALAAQPAFVWEKQGDTWRYRAQGLPKYLPGTDTPAVYTLTEGEAPHYKAQAAAVAAQNGTADFTNVLVMPTTSLTITKRSVTLAGAKLANASYILARDNEDGTTGYYTGTDAAGLAAWTADRAKALWITTGADGSATVAGIPYGSYWFQEVMPPAGHAIDTKPIRVSVEEANRTTALAVEQADPLLPTDDGGSSPAATLQKAVAALIPQTGDPSNPAVPMALAGISGAGLLLLLALRKKRRK